uniref:Uncharacterized protein n=1 Tax=Anguilla anguilla TaxID=7936 RepID=A0A0E9RIY6_ANGAN
MLSRPIFVKLFLQSFKLSHPLSATVVSVYICKYKREALYSCIHYQQPP